MKLNYPALSVPPVKGRVVSPQDLVFKVNGEAQTVIVNFAVSKEVLHEFQHSQQNVAVIPSKTGRSSAISIIYSCFGWDDFIHDWLIISSISPSTLRPSGAQLLHQQTGKHRDFLWPP